MECKTCKYTDLECQEQCKDEEKELKERIERCRDCMGATFGDCYICDEKAERRNK